MTLQVGTSTSQLLMMKIHVAELKRSFEFYTRLIGLKEVEFPGEERAKVDDGPTENVVEVCLNFSASPADPYIVLMKDSKVVPRPDCTALATVGLKVANTRDSIKAIKSAGYPVLLESAEFEGIVVGIVADPDGYRVQLVQAPSVPAFADPI